MDRDEWGPRGQAAPRAREGARGEGRGGDGRAGRARRAAPGGPDVLGRERQGRVMEDRLRSRWEITHCQAHLEHGIRFGNADKHGSIEYHKGWSRSTPWGLARSAELDFTLLTRPKSILDYVESFERLRNTLSILDTPSRHPKQSWGSPKVHETRRAGHRRGAAGGGAARAAGVRRGGRASAGGARPTLATRENSNRLRKEIQYTGNHGQAIQRILLRI